MWPSENRKTVLLSLVLTGILFGLGLPLLIDYIFIAGHSIGSADIGEDYFRAVIWALGLGFLLALMPFPKEIHKCILGLWLVRCLVTLGFMLVYENHYDLDAYLYFRESLARMEPDALGFGRGTSFINWMAWNLNHSIPFTDSYHTLKVFWSFAGLIGVYFYYQIYRLYANKHNPGLLLVLGAFPSALFWSSILGKDPFTFLGTALAVYGGLGLFQKIRLKFAISALIGFTLIIMVRFWLAGLIGFALAASMMMQSEFSKSKKVAFSVFSVGALAVLIHLSLEKWNISGSAEFVDRMNLYSRAWGRGGSAQLAPTFTSAADLAWFIPQGVFASLFRPLPGEILNLFGFLAGVENIILIGGAVVAFSALRKLKAKDPLVYFILIFIASWSLIYGFISYQNLGTASRFKLQVLPFMLMLPFYLKDKREGNGENP